MQMGGYMKKSTFTSSVITSLLSITSACLGLFYSFGGEQREVQNIHGQIVTLFGDGIYMNDSIMKVGATKGTDIAVIIVSVFLLITVFFLNKHKFSRFLQTGLLSIILYASTCLVMGVSFNRLFLLYVIQFGCALFAFILSFSYLLKSDGFDEELYQTKHKGMAIFMIVAGCSTLVWMEFIIPVMITGQPMDIIDIYTTEPTFAIDLAIIFPTAIYSGVIILKQREIGYKVASVIMILLSGVGLCVILQTIVQNSLGIVVPIGQMIGLVVSFVILGTIATFLNIKLLKWVR